MSDKAWRHDSLGRKISTTDQKFESTQATPSNGVLVTCNRCRALHRLATMKSKDGNPVLGTFGFQCGDTVQVAAVNGNLLPGFEIKVAVGTSAPHCENHAPKPPSENQTKH